MIRFTKGLLILLSVFYVFSFQSALFANEKIKSPIPVFVSILPQVFFVEQIGGEHVKVNVLVKPGKDPHTYSPSPDQIVELSRANVYFRIGVPFENILLPKIKAVARNVRIVDSHKNVRFRMLDNHNDSQHSHDAAEDKIKSNYDPHIWLSPVLARKLAENIYMALIEIDSDNKAYYSANYKGLCNKLVDLDTRIREALLPVKGGSVFVFHPTLGYFTDEYGLKQIAVEVEGKAPKGKDLSLFIKKAKKHNVKVIFVQPQFNRNVARAIANIINGVVVPIDPLAKDYIKNMEKIAELVGEALMSK